MRRAGLWAVCALALWGCEDGGGVDPLAPLVDLGPSKDAVAPAVDAGGGVDPDASIEADAAPEADAANEADAAPEQPDAAPEIPDAAPQPPDLEWPARDCTHTVRFEGDADQVLLAGEFTGWADAPIAMARDGGGFAHTVGPDDGLVPGQRYAYKIIVDGQWRIDPAAPMHKYVDACVNSAFELPACDAGPEIIAEPVATTPDGDATVRFAVRVATDESAIDAVEVTVDGERRPVTPDAEGRFELELTGLATGKHRVSIRVTDEAGRAADPVDLPFWIEAEPFDWRDSVLFLTFIDRFANGDRDSDDPVGDPVPYPADWHGGDLWGALEVLESGYFERLGVKAIWLSPANRQVEGHWADRGGDGRRFAAYHGYWPIRAREIDPRFGGDAALEAFVEAAHARGIRVLLDLINNQVHEQHEYFLENPEWFRTGCVCGVDPGCGWSERPLDCLFAGYLPDINWRVRGAEDRFIEDAIWWIERFDVDGFRVDAVKHVETSAVFNLREAVARRFEQGGTRIVMLGETAVGEGDRYDDGCGEIYPTGYDWISAYTGPNALDGQFDFPTHHRLQWGVLTGTMSYADVDRAIADYEARYADDALHVQFLGSHDSSRMASRAAQDPARDCQWPGPGCETLPGSVEDPAVFARLRRAWTLLYTMPGIPLLYYGDDIALAGGNDPDSRRDMPWGGALAEVAVQPAAPSAQQLALRSWLEALASARAEHPALTRGDRQPLLVEPDLYVYARTTADDLALVVLNRGGDVQDRVVPLGALVNRLPRVQVLAGPAEARVDAGTLRVSIPAGESALLAP